MPPELTQELLPRQCEFKFFFETLQNKPNKKDMQIETLCHGLYGPVMQSSWRIGI